MYLENKQYLCEGLPTPTDAASRPSTRQCRKKLCQDVVGGWFGVGSFRVGERRMGQIRPERVGGSVGESSSVVGCKTSGGAGGFFWPSDLQASEQPSEVSASHIHSEVAYKKLEVAYGGFCGSF